MDEFDLLLDAFCSMDIYPHNTMAVFRTLRAHPSHLEGNWRVALAEIFFPTSSKNVTITDYFIYTPSKQENFSKGVTGGVLLSRDDWLDNATFPEGEYTTIESIFKSSGTWNWIL